MRTEQPKDYAPRSTFWAAQRGNEFVIYQHLDGEKPRRIVLNGSEFKELETAVRQANETGR